MTGSAGAAVVEARRALAHGGRILTGAAEFFAPGRALLALLYRTSLDAAQPAVEQALALARRRSGDAGAGGGAVDESAASRRRAATSAGGRGFDVRHGAQTSRGWAGSRSAIVPLPRGA